jgi:small redox-active disulfide protein 2
MKKDIKEIYIGDKKVGLLNLETIFSEVQKSGLTNRIQITAELLRRVRRDNYIPVSAEKDYCDALYREYLRFQGEDITDEHRFVEIFILGPGCRRCEELERRVKNVVAELGLPANIEHIRDLKRIAEFGPAPTPGLVINGKLVLAGKVPSADELKKIFATG